MPSDAAIIGGRLGGDQLEHGFAVAIGVVAVS
jgi:hypothetical protein